MSERFLGIDTSCYTTSVAVLDENGGLLAEKRRLLTVPDGGRGLRQSEMVFQHVRNLPLLMEEIAAVLGETRLSAVSASVAPKSNDKSYMPAFLAGASVARSLAAVAGIPFYAASHQQNHVLAGLWSAGVLNSDELLIVHLSGGTTELLYAGNELQLTEMAETSDISAGQFIDRVGVALGLQFPAGAALEKLAESGSVIEKCRLNLSTGKVSFSGWETKFLRLAAGKSVSGNDIAATVLDVVARSIAKLILTALQKVRVKNILLIGGVASNKYIRDTISERIAAVGAVLLPVSREYCPDNAVGCACNAMLQTYRRRA